MALYAPTVDEVYAALPDPSRPHYFGTTQNGLVEDFVEERARAQGVKRPGRGYGKDPDSIRVSPAAISKALDALVSDGRVVAIFNAQTSLNPHLAESKRPRRGAVPNGSTLYARTDTWQVLRVKDAEDVTERRRAKAEQAATERLKAAHLAEWAGYVEETFVEATVDPT